MSSKPIRVLVVDDHALVREGVRALITSLPDLEFAGEAADGQQAIERARETRPDVVLMDLHRPVLDGISATRTIVSENSAVAVLVVSMLDDDASVFAALRAGARGYVLKGAETDELRRAIVSVASGDVIFGTGVATRVLDLFARPEPVAAPFPDLTDREREILDHVARGETNGVIARTLYISPQTVANTVSNILSKLHATDRTDIAIRARQAGLGGGPPTRSSR